MTKEQAIATITKQGLELGRVMEYGLTYFADGQEVFWLFNPPREVALVNKK